MSLNQTPDVQPAQACSTYAWQWFMSSQKGSACGMVAAMDPRDAVARALTTTDGRGRLLGERHCIPSDLLAEVPANAQDRYLVQAESYMLAVFRNGAIQRTIDVAAVHSDRTDPASEGRFVVLNLETHEAVSDAIPKRATAEDLCQQLMLGGFCCRLVSDTHGFGDYDVYGHPEIHRIAVGHGIRIGDNCNVYGPGSCKRGTPWRGTVDATVSAFEPDGAAARVKVSADEESMPGERLPVLTNVGRAIRWQGRWYQCWTGLDTSARSAIRDQSAIRWWSRVPQRAIGAPHQSVGMEAL